jgi:hypothetical protein
MYNVVCSSVSMIKRYDVSVRLISSNSTIATSFKMLFHDARSPASAPRVTFSAKIQNAFREKPSKQRHPPPFTS